MCFFFSPAASRMPSQPLSGSRAGPNTHGSNVNGSRTNGPGSSGCQGRSPRPGGSLTRIPLGRRSGSDSRNDGRGCAVSLPPGGRITTRRGGGTAVGDHVYRINAQVQQTQLKQQQGIQQRQELLIPPRNHQVPVKPEQLQSHQKHQRQDELQRSRPTSKLVRKRILNLTGRHVETSSTSDAAGGHSTAEVPSPVYGAAGVYTAARGSSTKNAEFVDHPKAEVSSPAYGDAGSSRPTCRDSPPPLPTLIFGRDDPLQQLVGSDPDGEQFR